MADAGATPADGDALATVLAWLHERTEHRLTVDAGTFVLDGLIPRGSGPGFRWKDESGESYELTVYAAARSSRSIPATWRPRSSRTNCGCAREAGGSPSSTTVRRGLDRRHVYFVAAR
jgi:hypothetical protein